MAILVVTGVPRSLRLIHPGVAAHIVQRGNNRAACFREEADYLVYLSHLRELSQKHGCKVHAYCLMTNHVHLLTTPGTQDACINLMRDLGQRYVQYFNRRYERSGTLWEGRYHSCVVESARYVLACHRYIELNPVRAGMVEHPKSYLWSSYATNSGLRRDPLISAHPDLAGLAMTQEERHGCYSALLDQSVDESLLKEIRGATNSGFPLASDAFKTTAMQQRGWKTGPGKPGPRVKREPDVAPDPQIEFGL